VPVTDEPRDVRLEPLATAMRARRRALGLRQGEVAELAGCSERFVYTVERAKPTVQLSKVLDVLGVLGLGLSVGPGTGSVVAPDADDETPR
jgi:HTH-type transcriptional regulator/antitoxin HipB